jgi:magnesium chelatase family protein
LFAQVTAAALLGLKAVRVTVEVDVGGGLPQITLVGLPDTAVQEAKERVRAAIKNSGFALPRLQSGSRVALFALPGIGGRFV